MSNAYKSFSTKKTSQKEKIPGSNQAKNNAGGFAWAIDDWERLDRFLILGSEGGTYYVGEQKLTKRNAEAVIRCIKEDGLRVVKTIRDVSFGGRAPKNDPALFALAMCAGLGNLETRKMAFEVLPDVARIGTHLFHFAEYVQQFRGWGRALRNGISNWYQSKDIDKLAYQVVKYQQRDGWSHRDLLRLSKPVPVTSDEDDIYAWVTGKTESPEHPLICAFESAKTANKKETIKLIKDHRLTREMIRTDMLNEIDVWAALLENMPLTAMIRNLGKMSSVGLLKPMSSAQKIVTDRLRNESVLKKSRIHPLQALVAMNVYQQGHGVRGSLSWNSVPQVIDALDDAFYLSFDNIEPTEKRILLGLDVSGSMVGGWGLTGGAIGGMTGVTPRVGSAAMAMATMRVESNWFVMGFTGGFVPLPLSPKQRLDDVIKKVDNLPFDRTDCAQPMLYAIKNNLEVDAFVIYTDSETWVGNIHPSQALQEYRNKSGINAKLIVVGMVSNGFSIADPNDTGMLDVVGFDTAVPNIMSNFIRG